MFWKACDASKDYGDNIATKDSGNMKYGEMLCFFGALGPKQCLGTDFIE
jgi:hypothetical protein